MCQGGGGNLQPSKPQCFLRLWPLFGDLLSKVIGMIHIIKQLWKIGLKRKARLVARQHTIDKSTYYLH